MNRLLGAYGATLVLCLVPAPAQVIEFENNGLKYQTLTKSGVTVMFAQLPMRVHEYSIVQVAISNGSAGPYAIRPEDFSYIRPDGVVLRAAPARSVVGMLAQKGSGSDVIKLITQYEAGIFGAHMKSTNGYEQRRQAALAMSGTKLKAAAAASALAMVQVKLAPGESTDGAVFFDTGQGKPLGPGKLIVRTNTDVFEFNATE
ncbi:MAG TPA: hypothetical protein VGF59_16345 [Bryobacteraceae bacterium]